MYREVLKKNQMTRVVSNANKAITMCLLMILMSFTPMIQDATINELHTNKFSDSEGAEPVCPLSGAEYEEMCREAKAQAEAFTGTISSLFEDDNNLLNRMTAAHEGGDDVEMATLVTDAYATNKPEGQSYNPSDEAEAALAIWPSPSTIPIDWFCILFPTLCGDLLVASNAPREEVTTTMADGIKFDWVADALIDHNTDGMITDVERWLVDDGLGRDIGDIIDFILLVWWLLNEFDESLADGPLNTGSTLGAAVAASMAYGMMGTDWTDPDDTGGIIWILWPVIIGIGILMDGCESSSSCPPPAPNIDELRYQLPLDFLDENPSYATQLFATDSAGAKAVTATMTADYREQHGQVLQAAVSYSQNITTPSEPIDSIVIGGMAGMTLTDVTNFDLDVYYVSSEPLSTGTDGRWWIYPAALAVGFLLELGWNYCCESGINTGGGSGSNEPHDSIREGLSIQDMSNSQDSAVSDYADSVNFVADEWEAGNLNTSAMAVQRTIQATEFYGFSEASEMALFSFAVGNALSEGHHPIMDSTSTDCQGWDDEQACSAVVEEVNEIYQFNTIAGLIFDTPLMDGRELTIDTMNPIWYILKCIWDYRNCDGRYLTGILEHDFTWAIDEVSKTAEMTELESQLELAQTQGRCEVLCGFVLGVLFWLGTKLADEVNGMAGGSGPEICGNGICEGDEGMFGSSHYCPADCGFGSEQASGHLVELMEGELSSIPSVMTPSSDGDFNSVSALLSESYSLGEDSTTMNGETLASYALVADVYSDSSCNDGLGRVYYPGPGGCIPIIWLIIGWLNKFATPPSTDDPNPFTDILGTTPTADSWDCPVTDVDVCAAGEEARVRAKISLNTMPSHDYGNSGDLQVAKSIEELVMGGRSTSCKAGVITAEDGTDGRSVVFPWWIIWALLDDRWGPFLGAANVGQGGDTNYLIEGLMDHDLEQPWNPPQYDLEALQDYIRLLQDLVIIWSVADLTYPQAIEMGMSPEDAHVFTVGIAIVTLVEYRHYTPVTDDADAIDDADARVYIPWPGSWQFGWLLRWLLDQATGGAVAPSTDCWPGDNDIWPPRDSWPPIWFGTDIDGDGIPNAEEKDAACWNTGSDVESVDATGCEVISEKKDGGLLGLPGFTMILTLLGMLGAAMISARRPEQEI